MPPSSATTGDDEPVVLTLSEEAATVTKRQRVRRRVRVGTVTHERPETLHETLTDQGVEVERVRMERQIDAVPPVRVEGDVTVLPVVEERLVITRLLFLVEEVRVQTIRTTREWKDTVNIRSQDIVVTETSGNEPPHQGGVGLVQVIRE